MSTTEIHVEDTGRGERRPGGGFQAPEGALQKKGKFELYSWLFMRLSGLALIFMSLYHLVWWNLMVGVEHLSAELVLARWNNPLWRTFNIGLATFALLHGVNGARYSVEDYIRAPGKRKAAKMVLYAIVGITLLWGVFALLTFDFTRGLRS
ncbi:MAG TPA: hypothetical protein VF665_03570 [Longimicrobium sp.]|jgi:succinate dehydrogenase / fumarate reductase membrane anchor subunit|uniref:succinate dehydrogenase, hydrophobic membrane anchor protein n=1 Tax=Longimicrobium sp. TaxID=2029185 RepID=UPI002ED94517